MRTNLRIISGIYKNRLLKSPASARPLTDRVKRTIFDTLGGAINNAKVLDLYAGSGNAGIECLSRGAKHVTFVEVNLDAVSCIQENLNLLNIPKEKFKIINKPIEKFANAVSARFDLIFVDPPFADASDFPVEWLLRFLDKEGIAILRFDKNDEEKIVIPKTIEILLEKEIGVSKVVFLREFAKI
ncbi:MAG: 16S rRNA (guanine(966)-N(2))-methyltransferase RsmD [Candidatus Dojkabacteria bacterium]